MIQKTVLTTLGLLLIYSLFIYVFRSSIQRTAQTVEQRNTVKAEEFLYENGQNADTIIVGSSMSSRLVTDTLGRNCYNLSLEGMASVDGLRLIAQAKHRSRIILVETNTLDRTPDTNFFAKSRQPVIGKIAEYLPFTRLKYQPVGVLKSLLRDKLSTPFQEREGPVDTAFVSTVIQEKLKSIVDIPQDQTLKKTIALADYYIRNFQREGVRIIFFEMPTDPRIRNIKVHSRLRQLVKEAFPASNYHFIPFPSAHYQTTDGVHLPKNEGLRYSQYLDQQLNHHRSLANL